MMPSLPPSSSRQFVLRGTVTRGYGSREIDVSFNPFQVSRFTIINSRASVVYVSCTAAINLQYVVGTYMELRYRQEYHAHTINTTGL